MRNHKLDIGNFDTVRIEKAFGPTIMCDIRITANTETCKWIIERMKLVPDENGDRINIEWKKMCEFDAQESIFEEGE